MVLRLDPRLPILWRSPSSVQVGTDPALVVLDGVSDADARLLAALAAGVSESGLAMLARTLGVDPERRDELVALLSPALAPATEPERARAGVLGGSALARAIAGLLSASDALAAPEDAALVVLVGDWVLAPVDHLTWLNRDVPHLPVLAAERSVTVGPLVEPGAGPCLYCVHLARADEDAAWPAVATQLLGRSGEEPDAVARAEVAAFVARLVLARLAPGPVSTAPGETPAESVSWRLGADGAVSSRAWRRHPACRCAAPAGSDWADVPPPVLRAVPTTAPVVGAPA